MMKNLMVLALVLSVVGLANAGLSVSGKTVSYESADALVGGINVYVGSADLAADALTDFVFRTVGAPTSAAVFTPYSGQDAVDNGLPWVKGFQQISWGDPVTTPNPSGLWFSFTVNTNVPVTVDVMDANTGVLESVVVTPEPMTMVLLGLGGLFLRRK